MMPNTHEQVKLVNARIADVENGCYYPPNVSLIIGRGKITAMPGLAGEPYKFPTLPTIDLHGLTIIPGLFNTHCHLQFIMEKADARELQITKSLADCLDRGVTNIRDTLCFDLSENQAWIDKIEHGQIPGPRIHQAIHVGPLGSTYVPRSSPMRTLLALLGWFPIVDYRDKKSGVVAFRPQASDQEVRQAVDRAIDERGASAIKLCDQPEHFMSYKPGAVVITRAQLEAAIDQASLRGLPTTMHNVTVSGFRQAIGAEITSLAHLPIDKELSGEDAQLLRNSHTCIEPTLTVAYYMSYNIKGSPFSGHPEIQRLDQFRDESYRSLVEESWLPELRKSHTAQHEGLRNGRLKIFGILDMSAPFRYMSKCVPIGGKNLKLLAEHGSIDHCGCGTDAGPSNCSPSIIHLELSMFDFMLNRNGKELFTAADALRTATLLSARSMGLESQFGSICPGKTADLVALAGDPLKDFHLLGKPVQALFKDGNLVINRCGLELTQSAGENTVDKGG
jgi:imidazolonepropionase-like amidohydrolase